MKVIIESFVIILTSIITFLLFTIGSDDYIRISLIISIMIFLITIAIKKKRGKKDLLEGTNWEIFLILTCILLLVASTGGITSPIFFLLYFLLFGITVMYEPIVIFVFVTGMIFAFFQQAIANDIFSNMIRLGSLLLLSPLAYFFGTEFKKKEKF